MNMYVKQPIRQYVNIRQIMMDFLLKIELINEDKRNKYITMLVIITIFQMQIHQRAE